jgi:uncharacterized membrane protein (UPF0127 family)
MEQESPLRLRGLEHATVRGLRVPVASSLRSRLLGLAFLRRRRTGAGLLLPACRSVHTFGMLFRLDVSFIDAAGREIRVERAVPPGRVLCERQAVAVLEVPSKGADVPEVACEGGESPRPAA